MRRGRLVACVCMLGIFAAALATSLDYSLMDALGPGPGLTPAPGHHRYVRPLRLRRRAHLHCGTAAHARSLAESANPASG